MPYTPAPGRGALLISLGATVLALIGAGTQYVYSVFGPQMAAHFALSGKASSMIASAVNFGYYGSGAAWGHFVDGSPSNPSIFFLLSGVLLVSGYFSMAAFYEDPTVGAGGNSNVAAVGMALCYFIVGVGSAGTYAAAIGTNMRNWDPKFRGIATGIPLAALGLSASLFAFIASQFFATEKEGLNVYRFLVFLGCSTLFLNLIASITLRDLRPRRIRNEEEVTVFNVRQARDHFQPPPRAAMDTPPPGAAPSEDGSADLDPLLRSISPIPICHLTYLSNDDLDELQGRQRTNSGNSDRSVGGPSPSRISRPASDNSLTSVGISFQAHHGSYLDSNEDFANDLPRDPPSIITRHLADTISSPPTYDGPLTPTIEIESDNSSAPRSSVFRILSDPEALILAICLMFISGAGLGYNNAVGSIVASLDAVRNVPLPSTAAATPSSSSAQSLHVAILSVVGCFARIISGVVSDRLASRPQSTQRRRRVEAPSSEDVDRGSSDNLSDDGLSEPRRINVGTASLSLPSPTTTTRSITALYGSVDEPIVPPEEAFLSLESQSPPSPGPHVLVTRSLLNLTGSWWTLRPVNSNRSHVDETASLLGPRRIENESGRSWWKKVWWRRNGEGEGERTKFGFRYWGSWNRLDRVFWIGVAASLMAWAHWMVAFTTFSLEDLVVPTIVVGVAYGTIMTVLPVVVAEAFGPKLFATNWGVLRIATAIGGQAFGLAFGDLYDRELRHQFPNPENVMLRTLTASPQVQNSTTFNFIPPESTFASVATPQTLQNICQGSSCFSTAFAISFGCNILAAVLAFALFGKRQSRKFGASALGNQQ